MGCQPSIDYTDCTLRESVYACLMQRGFVIPWITNNAQALLNQFISWCEMQIRNHNTVSFDLTKMPKSLHQWFMSCSNTMEGLNFLLQTKHSTNKCSLCALLTPSNLLKITQLMNMQWSSPLEFKRCTFLRMGTYTHTLSGLDRSNGLVQPTLFLYLTTLQQFPQATTLMERVLHIYKGNVFRTLPVSQTLPVCQTQRDWNHDFFAVSGAGRTAWDCPANVLLASRFVPDAIKECPRMSVHVILNAWRTAAFQPFLLSRETVTTSFSISQNGWLFDPEHVETTIRYAFMHYRHSSYRNEWTQMPSQKKRKKFTMMSETLRQAFQTAVTWQARWLHILRLNLTKQLIPVVAETVLGYVVSEEILSYHERRECESKQFLDGLTPLLQTI